MMYSRAFITAFQHSVFSSVKRRRTWVVWALVLAPAFLPVLVRFMPGVDVSELDGFQGFAQITEIFYISLATPLLALFFAAMLVGEDVESQTISYILTRPIPRSAWVLGRFLAFVAITFCMVSVSLLTVFAAAMLYPDDMMTAANLGILVQYLGAALLALVGYGAICMLLGATVPRPVIIGVLLIFGWQRGAGGAPGLTDFLTIEKYVFGLLPEGGLSELMELRAEALDTYRGDMVVSPVSSMLTLVILALVCLALTTWRVKRREFTTPVATTE